MTGFMGLTFSAFAGICFVGGLAVMTIQNEEDEDE